MALSTRDKEMLVAEAGILAHDRYARQQQRRREEDRQHRQAEREAQRQASIDGFRALVGDEPPLPTWRLEGGKWTPVQRNGSGEQVYTFDWSEGLPGPTDHPGLHWSPDAWSAFDRYRQATEEYALQYASFTDQWLKVVGAMTPTYVVQAFGYDFEKSLLAGFSTPRLVEPRTGLHNEYAFYNAENPATGEKIEPGGGGYHWAPAQIVRWHGIQRMLALYKQKLKAAKNEERALAEQIEARRRQSVRNFWKGIAVLVAAVAITALAISIVVGIAALFHG